MLLMKSPTSGIYVSTNGRKLRTAKTIKRAVRTFGKVSARLIILATAIRPKIEPEAPTKGVTKEICPRYLPKVSNIAAIYPDERKMERNWNFPI